MKPISSSRGLFAVALLCPTEQDRTVTQIVLADVTDGHIGLEIARVRTLAQPSAWSPSGRQLLFLESGQDGSYIYRSADLATARTREVFSWTPVVGVYPPVWLDDRRLIAVEEDTLMILQAGRRVPLQHHRDFGICSSPGKCPQASGIAVSEKGLLVETFESGDVVFSSSDSSSFSRTRSPDLTGCARPHFRPGGERLGLTCTYKPTDYEPSSTDPKRNHYVVSAWVIDVASREWFKVQTGEGGHEWGVDYFPWSPDGRAYLVQPFSESECGGGFYFVSSNTGVRNSADYEGSFGSFSPDGSSFIFMGRRQFCEGGESATLVGNLDGSPPRRLLSNSFNPLWSPAR